MTFRELDALADARDKQEWTRLAVCAFHANANIKPTPPKQIIPYQDEPEVEHVTGDEFLATYRRIYGSRR